MDLLPKSPSGCPYLFLAPMEGAGDFYFRKAISSIGGFDEAIREFIRVPKNAHVESLSKAYDPQEISPILLTPQIMGSNPELMVLMAKELEKKGALKIDLNFGCPSSTVTGKGAGSSILKDPQLLHDIAKAVVSSVSIPVSIKMRSGYEDTSLFKENLLAAEKSGIKYLTLHPRTKIDAYKAPANWQLIALAKSLVKIPIIGNGDILCVEDAIEMLKTTGCDGLMIGRGVLQNPFLFHQIRSYFSSTFSNDFSSSAPHERYQSDGSGQYYQPKWSDLANYLNLYLSLLPQQMPNLIKTGKMKQLLSFLFQGSEELLSYRKNILSSKASSAELLLKFSLPYLQEGFSRFKKSTRR
jgi:tRNA-dihydrouridine synthase C